MFHDSWGASWLGSWGDSWGYDSGGGVIPVEETRRGKTKGTNKEEDQPEKKTVNPFLRAKIKNESSEPKIDPLKEHEISEHRKTAKYLADAQFLLDDPAVEVAIEDGNAGGTESNSNNKANSAVKDAQSINTAVAFSQNKAYKHNKTVTAVDDEVDDEAALMLILLEMT